MAMHKLYHLTEKENVEKILKEGLIPQIGKNSELVEETEPCIYMSRRQDVPYWALILNRYEVLCITVDDILFDDLDEYNYANYKEYIYRLPIPASSIRKSNLSTVLAHDKYKNVLLSYLHDISEVCVNFAKYIAYYDTDELYAKQNLECAELCINAFKMIIPRLDYSHISTKELYDELIDMGESGMYTLCDTYDYQNYNLLNNRPQLWQLLGQHEFANDTTRWLYDWLNKTFPNKLYIDTGGWTG